MDFTSMYSLEETVATLADLGESACLLAGWLIGNRPPASLLAEPPPAKTPVANPFPMQARLGGNIFQAMAAQACIFRVAHHKIFLFARAIYQGHAAYAVEVFDTVLWITVDS